MDLLKSIKRIFLPKKRNAMDKWPEIVEEGATNPNKETKVSYQLTKGSMSNPIALTVITEQYCVYCSRFSDPTFRDPAFPKGGGYCESWNGVVGMRDSCKHWTPNTEVRYWQSKGYAANNSGDVPRNPWYSTFNDGDDGVRGAR